MAFCDWLCELPAHSDFEQQPEYRFFADLTDEELFAAEHELVRRYATIASRQEHFARTHHSLNDKPRQPANDDA